ncbi:MAG TPA: cytochrome c biogenesis protein ResB, partial [Telluria sp.]
FGYIFAHSAIIIILVGGMLDSDLPIQFQEKVLGKSAYQGGGLIADIPAKHKLSMANPTYRGNTFIPEGQSSDIALIPRADGNLLQPLPFTIELKKFIIDFYSTGMPKLFASEVLIRDPETGKSFPATIKVNEPLIYKGVAVYQSSFEDGGTRLKLTGFPMSGNSQESFALAGEVNAATALKRGNEQFSVEWSGFRPFNVENVAASNDARSVAKGDSLNEALTRTLDQHSGSAAKNANNKDLKNVGPSVQYKLRDATGQAREYQNYMQPVTIDGAELFLAGVRANPDDAFSYLRIPADDAHTVKEWMRMRAALADPALRSAAASRYARRALPAKAGGDDRALERQLQESAARSLAIFAGESEAAAPTGQAGQGGYAAVARFLEKIPPAEQENAARIFMKILNGTLWELWQAAREQDGLAEVAPDDNHGRFVQLAANALSDSFFYGAPVYLQLDEFVEVKASVLQVTRSPGKPVVYFGCLLLVMGVFAMFYIRERRLWVWIRADAAGGAHALMAMSTQRKTLDFENEFNDLKTKLLQSA